MYLFLSLSLDIPLCIYVLRDSFCGVVVSLFVYSVPSLVVLCLFRPFAMSLFISLFRWFLYLFSVVVLSFVSYVVS